MVTVIANQKRTTAIGGDPVRCAYNPLVGNAGIWIKNQPCVRDWMRIHLFKGFGSVGTFELDILWYQLNDPTTTKSLGAPATVGASTTSTEGIVYTWLTAETAEVWVPLWSQDVWRVYGSFYCNRSPRIFQVTAWTAPGSGSASDNLVYETITFSGDTTINWTIQVNQAGTTAGFFS